MNLKSSVHRSFAECHNLQVWSNVDNEIRTEEGHHVAGVVCKLTARPQLQLERILRLASSDHCTVRSQFFALKRNSILASADITLLVH